LTFVNQSSLTCNNLVNKEDFDFYLAKTFVRPSTSNISNIENTLNDTIRPVLE